MVAHYSTFWCQVWTNSITAVLLLDSWNMILVSFLFLLTQPFLSDLGTLLKEGEDEELYVEVLGILGNLTLPEIDFEKVISQLELMPFIISKLKVC